MTNCKGKAKAVDQICQEKGEVKSGALRNIRTFVRAILRQKITYSASNMVAKLRDLILLEMKSVFYLLVDFLGEVSSEGGGKVLTRVFRILIAFVVYIHPQNACILHFFL